MSKLKWLFIDKIITKNKLVLVVYFLIIAK